MQNVPERSNLPRRRLTRIESLGLALNVLAIVAFSLGLICIALPGLQMILDLSLRNLVFAPLYFLVGIHIGGIFWLVVLPVEAIRWLTGNTVEPMNGFTAIVAVCLILWLAIVWGWVVYAVVALKTSLWRFNRLRWLPPLLLGLLSLLWISHIPLSLTLTYHKPAFNQLVEPVMASPSGRQEFTPARKLGVFEVKGVYRESKTIASIEIDSNWVAQGFVRDLSGQPDGLAANTYSLAPGSNPGDQELFYLGDGWYVFQNLFD